MGEAARVLATCALGAALGACVTAPSDEIPVLTSGPLSLDSEQGLFRAEVTAAGGEIVRGDNALIVSVRTFSDTRGELESASAFMPAHGHGTWAPSVTLSAEAYRVQDLSLHMPGRWEVVLTGRVGARTDTATFAVDVR